MMTRVAMSDRQSADLFRERFRDVVVEHLKERSLDDPVKLAEALSVGTGTARALLRRRQWTLDNAAWIVSTLELPICLGISSGNGSEDQVSA